MKINIAYLYPELLNIYGDRGNVFAFVNRCLWRNIEANITEISIGDIIDPDKYDFYFIGGGQDQQQIAVSQELQKQKFYFQKAAENKAVFLAICGGYQLLGHYYKPHKGEELRGISLMDAYTVAGNARYIGNVTIKSDLPLSSEKTLVGFENHSGLTWLQGETKPIGHVIVGNGNNGKDKKEGGYFRNVFGTYLHGSLLPKNPHFTDYLIKLSLERNYGEVELSSINDFIEWIAHKKAIRRKY
jgi:hypothetical protein